jgi:hypothetical protein
VRARALPSPRSPLASTALAPGTARTMHALAIDPTIVVYVAAVLLLLVAVGLLVGLAWFLWPLVALLGRTLRNRNITRSDEP